MIVLNNLKKRDVERLDRDCRIVEDTLKVPGEQEMSGAENLRMESKSLSIWDSALEKSVEQRKVRNLLNRRKIKK